MENERLLEYYAGDELAASTWKGKYALKLKNGAALEQNPTEMHLRLATELADKGNTTISYNYDDLSDFGKRLVSHPLDVGRVFSYLDRYKYIIPQGSIMAMLGNQGIGSLSNCFVIPSPVDSYGGIFKSDQEIAQLEKRRGGVGLSLDTLRPEGIYVQNAAGSSTGAYSFMDRFSNTTREVAQNGRRGALMLLMSCRHPDIFKFVTRKADLTKVTGANVSVMLTDHFMRSVELNEDFICRWPLSEVPFTGPYPEEYNVLVTMGTKVTKSDGSRLSDNYYVMKIRAKELYDLIVEMAWQNAEPGVAFIDRIHEYCPEGVYPQYRPVASNPCGEQWLQAYDACRLLALNLYNVVDNPFEPGARLNYHKLYEISYVQQRLADNVVDLELKYVQRIIDKILVDPEPSGTKATELELWQNIKATASASRRTGCGFTALADMLAALGLKYDSPEAIETVKKVMKTKLMAELDATIDLAVLYGTFSDWDAAREIEYESPESRYKGKNQFYQMLCEEFPEQVNRMVKHGRRNVSWSTVAPTGTVSIVTILEKYPNTSAGVEPQFACYYLRNKKINPSDKEVRVDFVDKNGDSWMTYPVVMGGLKEWIDKNHKNAQFVGVDSLPKEVIEELFKKSPYYGSCANDIDWRKRVELQSIVQKYTTNAISSTLNLPKDVSKETVAQIYKEAWKLGLKGVTIYRDGCRTGVLNTEAKKSSFDYKDAVKRPKELEGELSLVTVKGIKYGVIVDTLDGKPYEVFAFNADSIKEKISDCKGTVTKVKKGHYKFSCPKFEIDNLQELAIHSDEQVLTRLISGMLRHGAKPQYVMEQIDKCDLEIVTFGKAISRTLKKYVTEEEMINRNKCTSCGSSDLRMQEGCMVCNQCSASKCG